MQHRQQRQRRSTRSTQRKGCVDVVEEDGKERDGIGVENVDTKVGTTTLFGLHEATGGRHGRCSSCEIGPRCSKRRCLSGKLACVCWWSRNASRNGHARRRTRNREACCWLGRQHLLDRVDDGGQKGGRCRGKNRERFWRSCLGHVRVQWRWNSWLRRVTTSICSLTLACLSSSRYLSTKFDTHPWCFSMAL